MAGIVAYGTYVPYWRLQRGAIGSALGTSGGKGTRAVASYDEDTTSMGVEAARVALRSAPQGVKARGVVFATADPAYLDKTNATAIHTALGLDVEAPAYDMIGSVRSGIGAIRAAVDAASAGRATLAVLSDIRIGLAGGADEREGGDGAAAFLFSDDGPILLETLGNAAATGEFLDRWRLPGDSASKVWEERFGEHAYVPLADIAIADAFKQADVTAADVDHLIVCGTHTRAVKRVAASVGARAEAISDDLSGQIGNAGTAQPGMVLASVLDKAKPGEVVVMITLADGAEVAIFRATEALGSYQRTSTVASQVAGGNDGLDYAKYLTWRGQLVREPPRRPDPQRPAGPPSFRREEWKYGFEGSRCTNCGTRHLPPARVCVKCHAVDQMAPERLADVPATIATYTVDRLAFSLNPPVVAAIVDFDGGGRFQCELTDVDPDSVAIGQRVQMTFRRLFTAEGVHNYFWKARPVRSSVEGE